MNGDIRPPRQPYRTVQLPPTQQPQPAQLDVTELPPVASNLEEPRPPKRRRGWLKLVAGLLILTLIVVIAAVGWYFYAQRPVDPSNTSNVDVAIASGMTPEQIADLLEEKQLIHSKLAFMISTKIRGSQGKLQAGQYAISPSSNMSDIIALLEAGSSNQFTITFYPGATIYDPTDIDDAKRTDVYTMLIRAGFGDAEVEAALDKDYDHPLFVDKPAGTSLEGYVYGETYTFGAGTTVEQVLEHTFDHFYEQIKAKDIIAKAKKYQMTLYEAITLASIIEREVGDQPNDKRQVSQIFHRRLDEGISLGADATFMYAAQQRNVAPAVDIDSKYNTRKVVGLPPGPIATPSMAALEAAVDPAPGDYLFFVSGDDGRTHFSHTQAEHDANTRKYCTTLCQLP